MPPREQLAARLRERGNALFRAGNYSEAASVYTAGLNQLPRGHGAPVTPMHLTLRLNRAACCISSLLEHTDSRSLHQAVSDCRYVIQHCGRDTKQEAKAQLRLGRALLELQAASDLPDAIAAFRRFKTLQPHSDLARDYLRRAEEERKAAEQRCEASRARGKEHCEDYDCEVCGGPPEHYFGDVDLDWSQFDAGGFVGDGDRYFVPPADRLSPCEGRAAYPCHACEPCVDADLHTGLHHLRHTRTILSSVAHQDLRPRQLVQAEWDGWTGGGGANREWETWCDVADAAANSAADSSSDVQPWTFQFAKLSQDSPWAGEWTIVAVAEEVVDGRVRFTRAVLSRCDAGGAVTRLDVCLMSEMRLSTRRAGLAGRLLAQAIDQCAHDRRAPMDDPHRHRARAAERAERRTPKWQQVHNTGGFAAASGDGDGDLAGAEEPRMFLDPITGTHVPVVSTGRGCDTCLEPPCLCGKGSKSWVRVKTATGMRRIYTDMSSDNDDY